MARSRDSSVVKLAVEPQVVEPKPIPFLGEFSLQAPLEDFIMELCTIWKISQPNNMALQYTEQPKEYVTENNRSRIKDGIVLHLVYSARKTADDILKKMARPEKREREEALDRLAHKSGDITFATEFINKQGMQQLFKFLDANPHDSPLLPPILTSCLDLLDHGIMKWDKLPEQFIERVASYVTCQGTIDAKTLSTSLTILENIVLNSSARIPFIEKQITMAKLLSHVASAKKCSETQRSVLALVNVLIQKSDPVRRKYYCTALTSRQNRTQIFNNVVLQHGENTSQGNSDLEHQLYVLQQLLLNQYEERMNTSMDVNDQDVTSKIRELRRIAFETDAEVPSGNTPRKPPEYKKEYKKLGFKNDINPAEDFKETPPGMLALDNMVYFANKHSDHYAKLVLENCYRADSHECPFGRASIELTKLLCEVLKIGEVPNEQGQSYHAMFFSSENIFEELFSICIVLLNKTWKEMKATTEDFSKVVSVVREQIKRSITKQPKTLDEFRKAINNLTYAEIAEIWRQERLTNEEQEMQAPPIKELRKALEPDILDLIQQHRLRFLVEGTKFKISRGVRAKDKFRYCRLSPNHKFLHHDECDEKSVPLLEDLTKKIGIVEIKSIVTGKDCPHMKEKGKKNPSNLAFSIMTDGGGSEATSLDFVAPDETTFYYWVDGLNALLRQRMPSPQTTADLEMLLNMEIKLRLLDAEGVTIPQDQPKIPPPPPNFNFHYQLQ